MTTVAGYVGSKPTAKHVTIQSLMIEKLRHRSPPGFAAIELAGGFFLQSLYCPGESHHSLPAIDRDRDIHVVGSLRLDNRLELAALLDLVQPLPSDTELALAAYIKWGDRFPEHFLGDFTCAIWDGELNRLLCVRDQLGVRPFYYAHVDGDFIFASEPDAILSNPGFPRRLNQEMITDLVCGIVTSHSQTNFLDLQKLAPAHVLILENGAIRTNRYWSPPPIGTYQTKSEAELIGEFRDLFLQAVACRIPSTNALGSALSGGLDSSSIVRAAVHHLATQNRLPLKTFSIVFDETPEHNERDYQESVVAMGGVAHTFVPGDCHSQLQNVHDWLRRHSGPVIAPGFAMGDMFLNAIQKEGVQVFLDGLGGDEVVSHGALRWKELALKGDWVKLAIDQWRSSSKTGLNPFSLFWRVFASFGPLRPLIWRVRHLRDRLMSPRVLRSNRYKSSDGVGVLLSPQHPDFEAVTQRMGAFSAIRQNARTEQEDHFGFLFAPLQAYAIEYLDQDNFAKGVEARYPFWDRRLVEFCVTLPAELKVRNGWSRYILRHAMEGLLPKKVQWRTDKFNFMPQIGTGLASYDLDTLQRVLIDKKDAYEGLMNGDFIQEAFDAIKSSEGKADDLFTSALLRAASVALFLEAEET